MFSASSASAYNMIHKVFRRMESRQETTERTVNEHKSLFDNLSFQHGVMPTSFHETEHSFVNFSIKQGRVEVQQEGLVRSHARISQDLFKLLSSHANVTKDLSAMRLSSANVSSKLAGLQIAC